MKKEVLYNGNYLYSLSGIFNAVSERSQTFGITQLLELTKHIYHDRLTLSRAVRAYLPLHV